jgi:hypothetical protein
LAGVLAFFAAAAAAGAGAFAAGATFTAWPAVAGAADVPTVTGIAVLAAAGMQLTAPATLVAGAVASFFFKNGFRLAIWATALPAVFAAVLVAFAVCRLPKELAVPAMAFMVPVAEPDGPHAGNPVVPAIIGDAPAIPAPPGVPAAGAAPAAAAPVTPLARP